jgi:uncharacterized ferritin-like protein (DUF455 family)
MPKRRTGGQAGRIALLHAVAHIELNAIDLAWDLIARFASLDLPRAFYDDWVSVADDEARHFAMVEARLQDLGAAYGELPAHDGLWEAAQATRDDLMARLAVVPMVLEARGLDVTPDMAAKMERSGDRDSAAVLHTIYREEVAHVAIGGRWFQYLCQTGGKPPRETWQALVRQYFKGLLKPPFNVPARSEAGLPEDFYLPLSNAA